MLAQRPYYTPIHNYTRIYGCAFHARDNERLSCFRYRDKHNKVKTWDRVVFRVTRRCIRPCIHLYNHIHEIRILRSPVPLVYILCRHPDSAGIGIIYGAVILCICMYLTPMGMMRKPRSAISFSFPVYSFAHVDAATAPHITHAVAYN